MLKIKLRFYMYGFINRLLYKMCKKKCVFKRTSIETLFSFSFFRSMKKVQSLFFTV